VGSSGYHAADASRQRDLAWRVLQHMTSRESQQYETDLGVAQPARYSVAKSPAFADPAKLPAHPQVALIEEKFAQPWPLIANWLEVQKAIETELNGVWQGTRAPKEAAAAAARGANVLLASGTR
jgi:ABC-type glycerol-3-phosphate transport system substrate-binding protein